MNFCFDFFLVEHPVEVPVVTDKQVHKQLPKAVLVNFPRKRPCGSLPIWGEREAGHVSGEI
jgi:hypothetical protein